MLKNACVSKTKIREKRPRHEAKLKIKPHLYEMRKFQLCSNVFKPNYTGFIKLNKTQIKPQQIEKD